MVDTKVKFKLDHDANTGDKVKRTGKVLDIAIERTGGGVAILEIKNENNEQIDETLATAWEDTRGINKAEFAPQSIDSLRIEFKEEKEAIKAEKLIYLKREVMQGAVYAAPVAELVEKKAATRNDDDKWTFIWSIKNTKTLKRDGNKLILEEGADFDKSKNTVSINEVNLKNGDNTEPAVLWDYTKSVTALTELENLLEQCFKTVGHKNLLFWSEKNTTPFTQQTFRPLLEKLEEYSIYQGVGKKLYFTGANLGDEDKNEGWAGDAGQGIATKKYNLAKIKSVLYLLETGNGAIVATKRLYEDEIDTWILYLGMFYNLRRKGFKYNHEVLIFFRLGFGKFDSENFKDKKFMGFEILKGVDGNDLEIEKNPAGTDFKIKGSNDFSDETFTNANINYLPEGKFDISTGHYQKPENYIWALRTLEVKEGGLATGTETAPFWEDWDNSGTEKSIFADPKRVSRQDLYGYQPQDIDFSTKVGGLANIFDSTGSRVFKLESLKNGDVWFWSEAADKRLNTHNHIKTRVKRLAAAKDEMEGAIKVLFAGFETGTKLEAEIPSRTDVNLNQPHDSKLAILNDYYDFIKGYSGIIFTNQKDKYILKNGKVVSSTTDINGDDDSQRAVDLLEGTHKEAQKWAEIWGTDYSSENDQAKCEKDESYLDTIIGQTATGTTPAEKMRFWINQNPVWLAEVKAKKTKIENQITELKKPKTPAADTLDALLADANISPVAKLIYTKAKAKGVGSDKPMGQLTTLVSLIEKAQAGTASASDLRELRKYKAATDATDKAKKEAWDLANEVEDSGIIDKSTNGAGADALQKMENALRKAKDDAKTAMNGEGGDADTGAYKKIGIESMDDKAEIEKITQMFNKLTEARKTSSYDKNATPALISELKGSGYKGTSEWNKIDQYQKGGEGFATGTITYLESLDKGNQITAAKILEQPDGNSAMKLWEEIPADQRKGVDKDTAERLAAAVELKKKGTTNEDKELGGLLGDKLNSGATYFPDVTKDSDKGLTDINDLINKLISYRDAADTDVKGKARLKIQDGITKISDAKAVLNSWISQLETRKATLESQKAALEKNKDDNENQPSENFWTFPLVIFGYCVLGAAIIGGIAWWALKGGSGEEEEENE